MSPRELSAIYRWLDRHPGVSIPLVLGVPIALTLALMIGGFTDTDGWHWQTNQFLLVMGVGGIPSVAPLVVFLLNQGVFKIRHRIGRTPEAKEDKAAIQARLIEKQACDIRRLEQELLDQPLTH